MVYKKLVSGQRETYAGMDPSSELYVPLSKAVLATANRVRDALTALSIAEIRQSVTMVQMVDTVNELHSAVGESISVAQLFLSELLSHDAAVSESDDKIQSLMKARGLARGTNAVAFKSVTGQLLDEVRRKRLMAPPTVSAGSVVVPRPVSEKAKEVEDELQQKLQRQKEEQDPIIKKRYKKTREAKSNKRRLS